MNLRPRCAQVDIEVESRPQTGSRALQGDIRMPGPPADIHLPVLKPQGGAHDADPVEIAQAAPGLGRPGQFVQQQCQDTSVSARCGIRLACGVPHIDFQVAVFTAGEADSGPDNLKAGRCDLAVDQGAGAQRQGDLANSGDRLRRVLFVEPHTQRPDIECAFPAGPCQDQIVQFGAEPGVLPLQEVFGIGQEKPYRNRFLGQPPCGTGDEQARHHQNATYDFEANN